MTAIKTFINTRLQILKDSKSLNSIENVIFMIKVYGEIVLESNIYLVPCKELISNNEKEKADQIIINKIIDKSFFTENNIEHKGFNLILFFSLDLPNHVDNCYIFDIDSKNIVLQSHDLNGNLITNRKLIEQDINVNKQIKNKKPPMFYLFFDTETTGLPQNWKAPVTDINNWPRLVQLAYLYYDSDGNKISGGDYIIKPEGYTIPSEASFIHGISTEKANKEGKPIASVLEQFNSLVRNASYLVAHNMAFDEKIVGAEFLRNGMLNSLQSKNKICTMESTTLFCALNGFNGYKWPKLSELHFKLFGTDLEEAHNAAIDISVTAKCFWELKKLGIIQC